MKFPFTTDPYPILYFFYDKFSHSPYLKLVVVLFGIFLFVILLAYVRQHVFKISMKGAVFGFFSGVILMLLVDLIIIFTLADKSKLEGLFAGGKRQEVFGKVMISGAMNINKILGATTFGGPTKPKTAQQVLENFLFLPDEEARKVKDLLCPQ